MSDDTQMLQVLQSVSDYLYKSGIGDGSTAVQDIVRRYERMKAEWIDPQRIVDLAKRYTDEGRVGWCCIEFQDYNPDMTKTWFCDANGVQLTAKSAADALKAAEA